MWAYRLLPLNMRVILNIVSRIITKRTIKATGYMTCVLLSILEIPLTSHKLVMLIINKLLRCESSPGHFSVRALYPFPMATSPASMLLMEEQIRSIIKHDTKIKYREKCSGLIPWGSQSPFGDFPDDYPIRKPDVMKIKPNSGHMNQYSTLAVRRRPNPPTDFRRFYERGDLPIIVGHSANNKLQWLQDKEKLDYHHYLPIFFDGLREQEEPYRFLSVQGVFDLLNATKGTNKIVPVIPQLIIPLKTALNTKDKNVVRLILKVIQAMIRTGPLVGEALVPYYRQLVPTMALYRTHNENIGDKISYGQRSGRCMGDLVEETLMLMEETGGSDAFINIKYMIPTYESTQAMGN